MTNVWQTRYRLLLEQLAELVDLLCDTEPMAPALRERAVRLLATATMLLTQHHINRRGQCKFCGWTRRATWFWRGRTRCTVYRALDLAMTQPLDVVWWRLFESVGRELSLEEVRDWIEERADTVELDPSELNGWDDDRSSEATI